MLCCDPEATRRAFAAVPVGSPESCGCGDCLNFAAARDLAYPPEIRAAFERLGIDYRKESEIWHTHRDESGLHHYGGFFHFVGSLQSGKDAEELLGSGIGTFDLEQMGQYFSFGFTSKAQLVPDSFKGSQPTQFEFQAAIPWVLNTPESDDKNLGLAPG
jgi:hypothetical protein